jgi:MFS family permease
MSSITEPTTWSSEHGHPRKWTVLVVLSTVAFMAQLDLFVVNVAVPAMGRSFHGSSLADLSWVLNAYAIVFGALLVPAGRLADHYGRRRFLLGGVGVFTSGSVLCAVAPSLGILVVGRVIQAVGAAAIVPTSLGLLLPVFPTRQHNLVVGASTCLLECSPWCWGCACCPRSAPMRALVYPMPSRWSRCSRRSRW